MLQSLALAQRWTGIHWLLSQRSRLGPLQRNVSLVQDAGAQPVSTHIAPFPQVSSLSQRERSPAHVWCTWPRQRCSPNSHAGARQRPACALQSPSVAQAERVVQRPALPQASKSVTSLVTQRTSPGVPQLSAVQDASLSQGSGADSTQVPQPDAAA
jgi:hypothetical protein